MTTLSIIRIAMAVSSVLAITATILLTIFMRKYEQSAVHVTRKENNIEIDRIIRDPKWKCASLISKTVAVILFITAFALFIWYGILLK